MHDNELVEGICSYLFHFFERIPREHSIEYNDIVDIWFDSTPKSVRFRENALDFVYYKLLDRGMTIEQELDIFDPLWEGLASAMLPILRDEPGISRADAVNDTIYEYNESLNIQAAQIEQEARSCSRQLAAFRISQQ